MSSACREPRATPPSLAEHSHSRGQHNCADAQEDKLGEPFVGRSGKLLDKILASVGLDRDEDVYVTNMVKRRPANNRDPTTAEMTYYLPWLQVCATTRPVAHLGIRRQTACTDVVESTRMTTHLCSRNGLAHQPRATCVLATVTCVYALNR